MLTDYRSTQHHPPDIYTAGSLARAEARYRAALHAQAQVRKRAELLAQSSGNG